MEKFVIPNDIVNENPEVLLEMILSAQMPSSDTWIDRLNVDFPKS